MKFRFEIQNCINVEVDSDCKENARRQIIENLEEGDYNSEFNGSCYVSDGELCGND